MIIWQNHMIPWEYHIPWLSSKPIIPTPIIFSHSSSYIPRDIHGFSHHFPTITTPPPWNPMGFFPIFPHFSSLPFEAQPQQAGQHRQQLGTPVPEDAAQGTQRCGEEANAEEEPWLGGMHGTVHVGWLVKKWGWKPLKHGIFIWSYIYIYNWIGLTTKTWDWYPPPPA